MARPRPRTTPLVEPRAMLTAIMKVIIGVSSGLRWPNSGKTSSKPRSPSSRAGGVSCSWSS